MIRDQSTGTKYCLHGTKQLPGWFVLHCVEIKLSVKVKGGFSCFHVSLESGQKQPLPAELIYNYARCKLDAMYRKRARWEYVFFLNRNFPARWKLHFHFHRSQTYSKSKKFFAVSSTLFLFSMGFLEVKKMTSATAKPVKVFDRLLV